MTTSQGCCREACCSCQAQDKLGACHHLATVMDTSCPVGCDFHVGPSPLPAAAQWRQGLGGCAGRGPANSQRSRTVKGTFRVWLPEPLTVREARAGLRPSQDLVPRQELLPSPSLMLESVWLQPSAARTRRTGPQWALCGKGGQPASLGRAQHCPCPAPGPSLI